MPATGTASPEGPRTSCGSLSGSVVSVMTFSAGASDPPEPTKFPALKATSQKALVSKAVTTAVMRMTVPRASFRIRPEPIPAPHRSLPNGEDPDRLFGMELQALARGLLSERPAPEAVVRFLRRAFRDGRNQ